MNRGEDEGLRAEDLRNAIGQAHEHLIAKGVAPEPPVVLEPSKRRRRWLVPAGILLVGMAGGVAYLALASPGSLSPQEEEADLRWAVGQVVNRIEAFRTERGRLPAEGDLFGLLSDHIVYTTHGDGYLVSGTKGPIQVEYDGTVPLGTWMEQSTQGGGAGLP